MKFFTILFIVFLIAYVIASCFVGYLPFLGKLATVLKWLTVGAGVLMAVFIGIHIYKEIRGNKGGKE